MLDEDKEYALDAAVVLDKEDRDAMGLFPTMLSYYGVELQSHASIGLGLVVVFFAIIQAYRVAPYSAIGYSLLSAAIGAGVVHQALRFYLWGKLASGIMYAGEVGFKGAKRAWNEDERHANPLAKWDQLSATAKVVAFTGGNLVETAGPLIGLGVFRYDDEKKVVGMNYRTLLVAFEFSLTASYFLIFGGSDLVPLGIAALFSLAFYYVVERKKIVRWFGNRGRKAVGLPPLSP